VNDLELAIASAEAGAAIVLRHFGEGHPADFKGVNDPVTAIDRASEAAIVDFIRAERPTDSIIAEEGAGGSVGGSRRWLIDPLDGTVNFVHGIPQVCVSVALYDGDTPLAAAIVDPIRHETFTAEAGKGAACNGRPITASRADRLAETVMATGFFYDHDRFAAEYTRPVTAVLEQANGVRRFGSAALDLAWTAAGRFDGYWELGVAPWDIAAGILLVREAGGIVTDPYGKPSNPEARLIVAAGKAIHETLRKLIESNLSDRLREGS
jgi:myo-inositol-1(or 4)-monophosphatase